MKIRCSALGNIMTNPKKKDEKLSAGCKTYIKELVKEDLFGYKSTVYSKPMDKGTNCEDISIDLYNEVFFTSHKKNEERLTNDFITGECDINSSDTIIDIKSAWSLETFPATSEDIKNKGYEWQLRGYMMLYNKPKSQIAYCMVSTPEALLTKYDNLSIHDVNKIDPMLRITTQNFERDELKEKLIMERVKDCRVFYEAYKNEILNKNI